MKKIVAAALAALISFAAFAGEVSVGGKLLGSYNLLGAIDDEETSQKFGFGIAGYGNFELYQNGAFALGLQPELRVIFNQGYTQTKTLLDYNGGETDETYTDEDSYSSLDFPLLLTFMFSMNDKVSIGAGVGPFVAVSLGHKFESKSNGTVDDTNTDITWEAGIAADFLCGIQAGPGRVVLDLGFSRHFAHSDGDYGLGYRLGNLSFGAGYQYTF